MACVHRPRFRFLMIWSLVVSLFSFTLNPMDVSSAVLPTTVLLNTETSGPDHDSSVRRIQAVLESRLVVQRLSDFGLSGDEIRARLGQLSDAQLHQIAIQLDAQQPGGDALGTVVVLLVIAILVVVLIQVSGHKVIITK